MKTLLILFFVGLTTGAVFAGQAVSQSQSEKAAEQAYDSCIRTKINQQGTLTPELVAQCRAVEH